MNTGLPTFNEAKDRVKIGHFVDLGYNIKGVVHVGAHNGYEVEFYLKMGIDHILAFEPLKTAYEQLVKRFRMEILEGKVVALPFALGLVERIDAVLSVAAGDGQSSGFLPLKKTIDQSKPYFQKMITTQIAEMKVYEDLIREKKIDNRKYDCLVIDAQGMELEVLEGMGLYINDFKYLNIECSNIPIYEGEVPASDIIAYLDKNGFKAVTDVEEHNDILFVRKDLLPAP